MYNNKSLIKLMVPLIIEQVLTVLMGTVDTLMVSNVSQAAISGVSLVDSINVLVVYLLSAIASGGAVICAQYMGRRDKVRASGVAKQVILTTLLCSGILMAFCLVFRSGLLRLIFGKVDEDVMEAAKIYFLITALSYPFLAYFDAEAALFRAAGNSRLPMNVSVIANLVNIAGNAFTIFVLHWGVMGAALSTLLSRAVSAVIMFFKQKAPDSEFDTGSLLDIRPDGNLIKKVLAIGLPTGVENSMFQFGKLVVQSTVSTLGTVAIASNALVAVLEYLTSAPGLALGTGLITVAGQCIGAGKLDEARHNIRKITLWSFAVMVVINWGVYFCMPLACRLAGMDEESTRLSCSVMLVISIVKPFLWPLAFTPANGMRAAGDVKFNMMVTVCSMWIFRVGFTTVLCRFMGVGLIGIWTGYFVDWFVRSCFFTGRFLSGRWTQHKVI